MLFLPWMPLRHAVAADTATPLETAIKATYLAKFESFITWPEQIFASSADSFNLCVVGGAPFGALLDRAIAGQTVMAHPIKVIRLPVVSRDDTCQIAYIATNDSELAHQSLTALAGMPVLTITDAGDDSSKGMINFVVTDNHVRFEINDEAAKRSGLVISSKLLGLAVSVKEKP